MLAAKPRKRHPCRRVAGWRANAHAIACRITQSPVPSLQSSIQPGVTGCRRPAAPVPTRLHNVVPQTRIPEPNCRPRHKVTARRNLKLCVRARSNRQQRLAWLSQPLLPLLFVSQHPSARLRETPKAPFSRCLLRVANVTAASAFAPASPPQSRPARVFPRAPLGASRTRLDALNRWVSPA